MASFKTKTKKKVSYDNRITLEAKHNEIIDKLTSNSDLTDYYNTEINSCENEIKELEKNRIENIDEIIDLQDRIIEIKEQLKNIDNQEIDYYLDNGKLLFDYYETKEKVATGQDKIVNNIKSKAVGDNKKSVINYFSATSPKVETTIHSKDDIVNDYFFNTDENFIKKTKGESIDICTKCNIEKILYLSEGKVICKNCGDETEILIDSDKPSYKDPPREVTYFSYKRINHFNECLAQFQAKETTDIPQEVYDKIILELKKERIKDMTKLTSAKIRQILKKLKKNKYYEHVPHIINKLNGISPPVMSRETEETLRRMFKEIQVPFHKFCPKDRKNFLSYNYVLRKFVELLELDEFIECFVLLKNREKLNEQDKIWKDICNYLHWEFIPSV
jgi:hypothetical protein